MSLSHFFLNDQVLAGEEAEEFTLCLSTEDEKHARVLRLAPGEHVAVVDADTDYFECEVVSMGPNGITVRIAQHLDAPRRPQVTLVQGLAKGDKMDDIIRHATEVGIAGMVPLVCSRSVVRLDERKAAARLQRWQTIAKNAAMQSGRTDIPSIAPVSSASEAVELLADMDVVLVCWEEAVLTQTLRSALDSALSVPASRASVAVVVGPEGGLTSSEVSLILDHCPHARAVSLGPSILRTETAGVVAPALVLYELEGRQ